LKKIVFVMIFFFCIVLASASNDFRLNLDKKSYSTEQTFQGSLIFEDSGIDISKTVSADITECGSYDNKEVKLYDLLVNAGIYFGPENEYTLGLATPTMQKSVGVNATRLIGLFTGDEVDGLNFSVSGSGSGLFFDIGNDGIEDWHYLGSPIGWSNMIYSEEYDESYNLNQVTDFNPRYGACNDIEVSFDDLNENLKLAVVATAKRNVQLGGLFASIGSKSCNLTQGLTSSWSVVSCEIELDVSGLESPHIFNVCLESDGDGYWLPRPAGSNYFFFNLKKALYNESLGSNKIYFSDSGLVNKINDYTNDCHSGNCVIPVNVRLVSGGSFLLSDLILEYGQSRAYDFYEITAEPVMYNLSNVSIPLSSFYDLKTPNVGSADTCILKMSFEGENQQTTFNVSPGPVAVISASSYYIGKDMTIHFDADQSFSQSNVSIESWKWNLGNNETKSGSSITYAYPDEGDYNVSLTIKDSNGMEDSDTIIIHVVPLVQYLTQEFSRVDSLFNQSLEFLDDLTGDTKEFSLFMNYPAIVATNEDVVNNLRENFTSVQNSISSDKDSQYVIIANKLNELLISTPYNVTKLGSKAVKHLFLTGPGEVFSFGLVNNNSNFAKYSIAVYDFNKDSVNVDMNSSLINVQFLDGDSKYVYVRKNIIVDSGTNNKAVEDIRDLVSSLDDVYSDAQKDSQSGTIYWNLDSGSKFVRYVLKTNSLSEIKTIVYSDVDINQVSLTYCYSYSNGCERYCGDGNCDIINYLNVDEMDDLNENYCAQDCVRNNSVWKYVTLFIIFFLVIIYLLVYKGPGNFKQLVNAFSYGVIHKKLFISEKDRMVLVNFISNALRRGFNKDQINIALLKKGWQRKQIDYIWENYINKKD